MIVGGRIPDDKLFVAEKEACQFVLMVLQGYKEDSLLCTEAFAVSHALLEHSATNRLV